MASAELVGLVEQIELKLGGDAGRHAERAEPRDLFAQHGAGAMGKLVVMVMIEHVAKDEGRGRQPGDAPERRQVRLHDEIAVALLPIGDRVARHRLHVDVVGEEIVAAMRFLMRAGEEIFGVHALADQPALHIGEANDDRVDLATIGSRLQLLQRHQVQPCRKSILK